MKVEKYFLQAVRLAFSDSDVGKTWLHAAIGIRADGAIVYSRNHKCKTPAPSAHAERRVCRKLGIDSPLVIVVRVNKQGQWMMSKPCLNCQNAMRRCGVKRVLYSVAHEQYEQMRL